MDDQRRQELQRRFEKVERLVAAGDDPTAELMAIAEATVERLTPEESARVGRNLAEKDVIRRINELTERLNEILASDKSVVAGETLEQRASEFEQLVEHARLLWRDAVTMFERRRYATAVFLATACMEEVGKGGIARLQVGVGQLSPSESEAGTQGAKRRRRKSALYSHPQKHVLVAAQGALINSQLDRLLGFERLL